MEFPPAKRSTAAKLMELCALALPVACNMVLYRSMSISSVFFAGRIGETELAACALGTTVANVVGDSMIQGVCGVMETVCSQAYGARNHEALSAGLQRGIILAVCMCVPLSFLWLHAESVLLALGQDPQLSSMAAIFLLYRLPGLWIFSFYYNLHKWLHAHCIMRPGAFIMGITAPMHVVFNYVLIHVYDVGYIGVPIATTMSYALSFTLMLGYVAFLGKEAKSTWTGWSRGCLWGWGDTLRLALPALIMISEWWASEISILLGGTIGQSEVAAMSIYQSSNVLAFMIPVGISVAAGSKVGNYLGAGEVEAAAEVTKLSLVLCWTVEGVQAVVLTAGAGAWAGVFTDVARLRDLTAKLLRVLAVYMLFDGQAGVLSGVLKGAGRQGIGAPVVVVAYWVFGLPLAYLLGIYLKWGAVGLVTGMTVGTAVHSLLFLGVCMRTDWQEHADRAARRIANSQGPAKGKGRQLELSVTSGASSEGDRLLGGEEEPEGEEEAMAP